jgi:hypothetical protein
MSNGWERLKKRQIYKLHPIAEAALQISDLENYPKKDDAH